MSAFIFCSQRYCITSCGNFAQQNEPTVSQKAVLALCLAILLPLVCYFIVKGVSQDAAHMPRHLYVDTVVNKVVRGKEVSDTVWHRLPDIQLTNQLGKQVSMDDLKGRIIVADFFFTRCPSICPALTRNMKALQDALKMRDVTKRIDTSFVHFLSFSIDPERDSVPVLKKYADRYGINHDVWWLLTGPKKEVYDYAINEMKLGVTDGGQVDSNFIHSPYFVLLDKDRVVRGYYNGLDSASLSRLAEDIPRLMLERDKSKPSAIMQELAGLWPIFIVVIIAVIALVIIANKKPKTI